ncbi:Catenin alpha-2 [Varanus komodoensis]|nr:Catenin alpha-2 [Varanus komodoensis]
MGRANDMLRQPHGRHGGHEVLSHPGQNSLGMEIEVPQDQHPGSPQHQVRDDLRQLRQEVCWAEGCTVHQQNPQPVMPRFAEQVEVAIEALSANVPQPFEENEFIDASRLVYDGVRDIRKAVLMIRTPEELEDDSDFEQEDYDVRSRTSVQTEDDQLIAGQSARPNCLLLLSHKWRSGLNRCAAGLVDRKVTGSNLHNRAIMAQLPQEEKAKIAEQVEIFHQEKSKLDAEVAKWDDSGNDIIVLAKQMCMIMMEMTDFTRGKGPLKNTSDVINAAKKIAEAGSRMDKLARAVADQCPDSACKQDLLAYLQRIALYCHQLNICSKVKAEVQNLGGELIVSGTGVQSTFTTFYEVECDVIDGVRASPLSTHLPTCAEGATLANGGGDSSMVSNLLSNLYAFPDTLKQLPMHGMFSRSVGVI